MMAVAKPDKRGDYGRSATLGNQHGTHQLWPDSGECRGGIMKRGWRKGF